MTTRPQRNEAWPLVSIGLPVFNGERFLEWAIQSLLAQDYPHFEIVISDNASTDRTREICLEYAGRYGRIRYQRAERNGGAVWNFNRVFELSRGEFFMWAAHDDLWEPSCIRRCVQELQAHPEAALCHSSSQPINPDGRPVGEPYLGELYINDEPTARGRWRRSVSNRLLHATIYGVMRRAAAEKTRLIRVCIGADAVFVAELSLHGTIIALPESLSRKRVPESMANYRTHEEMLAYLGRAGKTRVRLAHTAIFREFLRGLSHADLNSVTHRRLFRDTARAYFLGRVWLIDLKGAAISVVGMRRYQKWSGLVKPIVRGRTAARPS